MKIQFRIHAEHGAVLKTTAIMEKSCGLVAIAEVESGTLLGGDCVGIQSGDKMPLYDEVRRIELDHEKIAEATTGMLIGVLLSKTTKAGLLDYLGV